MFDYICFACIGFVCCFMSMVMLTCFIFMYTLAREIEAREQKLKAELKAKIAQAPETTEPENDSSSLLH